jgi:hypothetical protein
MDKVQILTTCRACGGQAYLPTNEVMTSADGREYIRHIPCVACEGSGRETRWIDLHDFVRMLNAIAMEDGNPRANSDFGLALFDSKQKENIK